VLVVADDIAGADKEVEFDQLDGFGNGQVDVEGVQYHIDVVAPVIDLGDVQLLQGVVDGQGMEVEGVAQERLESGGPIVRQVNPQQPPTLVQGGLHLGQGQTLVHGAIGCPVEGTDHGAS